jgi:hypothetical protein
MEYIFSAAQRVQTCLLDRSFVHRRLLGSPEPLQRSTACGRKSVYKSDDNFQTLFRSKMTMSSSAGLMQAMLHSHPMNIPTQLDPALYCCYGAVLSLFAVCNVLFPGVFLGRFSWSNVRAAGVFHGQVAWCNTRFPGGLAPNCCGETPRFQVRMVGDS